MFLKMNNTYHKISLHSCIRKENSRYEDEFFRKNEAMKDMILKKKRIQRERYWISRSVY